MINLYTPFSYSFSNAGTVSNFWTPHDEIVRGYFELSLPRKAKWQAQVFRAHGIRPTWQDVLQM